MDRPLLSIGMIVKNEIRCIEKCIKALRPLRDTIPCQLVIADTGSNDGTREVAGKYADLLFDFEWVNDFSAARNAVLERCTGKWILTVDADEYLDSEFSELVEFLTGAEETQYNWACVDIINYPDMEMKGDGVDFLAARLAKASARPHYLGTIHEYLSLQQADAGKAKPLLNVKFHHDGYARDQKHPERTIQKGKRNLVLLDQELEKNPQNLKVLMQCQESASRLPAHLITYSRRGMRALSKKYKTAEGELWGPVLVCHALETASAQKMPELEEWRRVAENVYPDTMSIRLDATYALIQYYVGEMQYDKVPLLVKRFLTAWIDFRDRNFDINILARALFRRTPRQFEVRARAAGCEALARLGQAGEAAALLEEEPDWDGLKPAELRTLLVAGTWAAGEKSLQEFVAAGAEIVQAMTGQESEGMWDTFRSAANAAFLKRDPDEDAPERPWRLFSKVKGGLGQAVRLMEGELPEVQEVLFQIKAEDWEDVPAPAVARAVELGAELPEAFFTQSRERLAEIGNRLCEDLSPEALLDWVGRWDFTFSMTRFQFLFDLLSAMMCRKEPWEEAEEEGAGAWRSGLCQRFLDVAADYLPNYYSQELLSDESEWTAIPGLHRGALYLLQGRASREGGDELGHVRALRAALKAAPAMKPAVAFLMESARAEAAKPAPELLALAEQVKAILAQYPDGDPAVAELKASPAYQKVAYLIEGPVEQN